MKKWVYILIFISTLNLEATYRFKDGQFINEKEVATLSVQEHYSELLSAYQNKDYPKLVSESLILKKNFPSTPFAHEALFYLGIGYFHLGDYELANEQFSLYLKKQSTPKHFEEAIQYKFDIAEKFEKGAKKHVMGLETMPKWVSAEDDAIAIFDEVITALPNHILAAKALFAKAKLLFKAEEFNLSVETYQTLIRRFPKTDLASESYLSIGEVYLAQCKLEYPDPDFLDLAEINLKKFTQDFPSDERILKASQMLEKMQEVYAKSLYETAKFFERTKKPRAAMIYYNKIISKYPESKSAKYSQERLQELKYINKDEKGIEILPK